MKKIYSIIKSEKLFIALSFIESFFLVYGYLLSNDKSISNFNFICCTAMFIFTTILFIINYNFKKLIFKLNSNNIYKYSWTSFFIFFIIMIICWTPILLAYYPGLIVYDIGNQLPHIFESTNFFTISAQHPIAHTLFMEFFVYFGNKLVDYTFAFLMLSIVQMIILSLSLCYGVEKSRSYIKNKNFRNVYTVIVMLFFCLTPFIPMLAITTTKDVLFTALFIVSFLNIYDILKNNIVSKQKIAVTILFMSLTMLFKNSYICIVILCGIILIIFTNKNIKKNIIKVFISSIVIYYLMMILLNFTFKPSRIDKFEKYSVPVHTMTYTYLKHEKIIQYKYYKNGYLFGCLKTDSVDNSIYYYNITDKEKNYFNNNIDDSFSDFVFLSNWIKLGLEYPIDYIDSYFKLYKGAWYIFDESYASNEMYPYYGYLDTENHINIVSNNSKLPFIKNKLDNLLVKNSYLNNIFLKLLLAPSLYVLSIIYLLLCAVKQKKKNICILSTFLILLLVQVLTGPAILIRYMFIFMIMMPFYFSLILDS